MNWLDVAILVILGVEMFTGWRAGFIGMVASFGGLILGGWLALRYSGEVAAVLGEHLVGPSWLLLTLAFLGIFLIGRYSLRFIGELLRRAISAPGICGVDHLAGAGLGLLVGSLVVMLVLSLFTWLPWPQLTQAVQESELGQYFWSAAPVFMRFFWRELVPVLSPTRYYPGGQQTSCPSSCLA